MKFILLVWTTISFSFIFLAALGAYPFHDAKELTIAGLYVGLGSGVAWGVSVHGRSRWNSVFNYVAAALTVLSVAYLTSDTFMGVCDKQKFIWLCGATKLVVSICEWIWSLIGDAFNWVVLSTVSAYRWALSWFVR
jgi:hypothetical protein